MQPSVQTLSRNRAIAEVQVEPFEAARRRLTELPLQANPAFTRNALRRLRKSVAIPCRSGESNIRHVADPSACTHAHCPAIPHGVNTNSDEFSTAHSTSSSRDASRGRGGRSAGRRGGPRLLLLHLDRRRLRVQVVRPRHVRLRLPRPGRLRRGRTVPRVEPVAQVLGVRRPLLRRSACASARFRNSSSTRSSTDFASRPSCVTPWSSLSRVSQSADRAVLEDRGLEHVRVGPRGRSSGPAATPASRTPGARPRPSGSAAATGSAGRARSRWT